MKEVLVFLDEGFLYKLIIYLDRAIKFDRIKFADYLAKKQGFLCNKVFYYNAPPFQSDNPTKEETIRKKGYDKFISALMRNKKVLIREGRCQKIINIDGKIDYNQKGVDTLLTIDMSHIKEDYPDIKNIILVSADTDFCPIIRDIKSRDKIEVILYTYFDRKRKSKFSLSNELINCCSKYVKLTKEDFINCKLDNKDKEENKKEVKYGEQKEKRKK